MIYFDNAATGGHKPDEVISATTAALSTCVNPGRSGHKLSLACLERVYAVRRALCDFFGGASPDRVIFTKNCTEALNVAILGGIKAGSVVVTTAAEHNSVLRPLEALKRKNVQVRYAPLNCRGEVDLPVLFSMVAGDKNMRPADAAVINLASNVSGASPDIEAISRHIPPYTLLICDGAQACGHIPVDMKKCRIDALAVAGHKGMLAMQGSGALLLSERFSPDPLLFGGTGSESYNANMPDFYPDRLESGTLCYPAIVSLGEGALYLKRHMYENKDKLEFLCSKLVEGLEEMENVALYSRPNPFGIVAVSLKNMQSEEAAYRLSEEYSVCVRGGLHCAPLMHKALGSDGLVRISLSPFNTEREVEMFLCDLKKLSAR